MWSEETKKHGISQSQLGLRMLGTARKYWQITRTRNLSWYRIIRILPIDTASWYSAFIERQFYVYVPGRGYVPPSDCTLTAMLTTAGVMQSDVISVTWCHTARQMSALRRLSMLSVACKCRLAWPSTPRPRGRWGEGGPAHSALTDRHHHARRYFSITHHCAAYIRKLLSSAQPTCPAFASIYLQATKIQRNMQAYANTVN